MTIADILATSPTVLVDLLTAEPLSQDPSTWARPLDGMYYAQPAALVVTLNQLPSGLSFKVDVAFPPASADWVIVAVGVTYQGQYVTHNLLTPASTWSPVGQFPLTIIGSAVPVQKP